MNNGDFIIYNGNNYGVLLSHLTKEESKQCDILGQLIMVLNLETNKKEELTHNYEFYSRDEINIIDAPNHIKALYLIICDNFSYLQYKLDKKTNEPLEEMELD